MEQISAFVPLSTKLFIPNVRPDLVPRPRLIEQMDHGASRKLTLVSAPAGFGKTTLVACWLRGQTQKTVWLSLDQLDNELLRLIAYIVAGFRAIDPKAMAATATLLDDSTMPLIEHYVQSFVADLLDFGQPVHLAIDDYHTINNREIHEFFIRLIADQPANLHLIIATRSDPLLPLPKLRVADEIIEIRVADLQFSTQEVSEYIISSMGETADIETIDSTILQEITRNTEGWIAGLRLLMLAVHSHNSDNPLAERVASRARDLAIDYLIAEVLQYQPEDVRQFLLFSSIVDRFHTDLVAELTGQNTSQVQETMT